MRLLHRPDPVALSSFLNRIKSAQDADRAEKSLRYNFDFEHGLPFDSTPTDSSESKIPPYRFFWQIVVHEKPVKKAGPKTHEVETENSTDSTAEKDENDGTETPISGKRKTSGGGQDKEEYKGSKKRFKDDDDE